MQKKKNTPYVFARANWKLIIQLNDYLSAIERAFSTSAKESINAMYFIQTKLLFGEILTTFSNSSALLGISFSNSLSSAALISRSLSRTISILNRKTETDSLL